LPADVALVELGAEAQDAPTLDHLTQVVAPMLPPGVRKRHAIDRRAAALGKSDLGIVRD
jgi:hypothetical protein